MAACDGDCAVEGAGGQVAQSLDLVAGDAGGAQRFVGRIEQKLRRGIAAEVCADSGVDGGRGLAVQLLVKDRFEQGLEGRGRRIEAEGERAGAIDERGEFGVAGAQVRHCLGGIEGKLAAAAVVNHGRSVPQVAARQSWMVHFLRLCQEVNSCHEAPRFCEDDDGRWDRIAAAAWLAGLSARARCARAGPRRQTRTGDVQVPL